MAAADHLAIRFADHLRDGDLVVVGSGVGEPEGLVAALGEQLGSLPRAELFAGISYSGLFTPELVGALPLSSFGAMGEIGKLAKAGLVNVLPINYVDVAKQLRSRNAHGLVLLIQVAPADADGNHSFGAAVEYAAELIDDARLVIAEINDRVPVVRGASVHTSKIDASIETSRELREIQSGEVTDVHRAIAAHIVPMIADGATLQLGIGGVPSAVASQLGEHRRHLRVHSGLVGDWLLDLEASGALDPAAPIVVGGAAGSAALYDFLSTDPRVELRIIPELTRVDITAPINSFVALNSAVQVDLSGQINAEVAGDRYLGGVGGQVDFLRGGQLSHGGLSIVALQATAGARSRIVRRLDQGVVTTARSGVDTVVTEFGVADLRGLGLRERADALAGIAAPEFRKELVNE
ncbi:MAG: Acyl-CoA hydrolase [Microbacteriaceae bacterium]|jgi:acyl-CoA hydrolase|nr:Acyl-CoA hydrolase [Microbacteriaceae bacterium]